MMKSDNYTSSEAGTPALAVPSVQILVDNAGKRFNREWIFRHLNFEFSSPNKYAITGPNGSGKSTALQVIAGATLQSQGTVSLLLNGEIKEDMFKYISIAAPYLELIEEMTAKEFLHFHASFATLTKTWEEILNEVDILAAADKQIRNFSSGMKQRLKLAQAFFSNTPVLLLDEPTTNLDSAGVDCYLSLIEKYTSDRLVIVCSNDEREYGFCNAIVDIREYK